MTLGTLTCEAGGASTCAPARGQLIIKRCEQCGADFTYRHVTKRKRFCAPICAALFRSGVSGKSPQLPEPSPCPHCGEIIVPKSRHLQKFCSDGCRSSARIYPPGPPKPRVQYAKICQGCGVDFLAGISHARFCSRECYSRHRYATAGGVRFVCVECGKEFFSRQRAAKLCGPECQRVYSGRVSANYHERNGTRRTEEQRQSYDAKRNRWRADIYRNGERFARREIFHRDGWRCGICGGAVLRRAKWPHPKSPSIDHILPLSEGGAHTRQNVQCAHLGCNVLKQNGSGGQYRLFG